MYFVSVNPHLVLKNSEAIHFRCIHLLRNTNLPLDFLRISDRFLKEVYFPNCIVGMNRFCILTLHTIGFPSHFSYAAQIGVLFPLGFFCVDFL